METTQKKKIDNAHNGFKNEWGFGYFHLMTFEIFDKLNACGRLKPMEREYILEKGLNQHFFLMVNGETVTKQQFLQTDWGHEDDIDVRTEVDARYNAELALRFADWKYSNSEYSLWLSLCALNHKTFAD